MKLHRHAVQLAGRLRQIAACLHDIRTKLFSLIIVNERRYSPPWLLAIASRHSSLENLTSKLYQKRCDVSRPSVSWIFVVTSLHSDNSGLLTILHDHPLRQNISIVPAFLLFTCSDGNCTRSI